MKISIYSKEKENKEEVLSKVQGLIDKYGHEIDDEDFECVLYIGGDGTFLRAVHDNIDKLGKIFFVGIHNGKLGFFYDYTLDEIEEIFKTLKEIDPNNIHEHKLLKAELDLVNGEKEILYAINEIRIENPFHTLVSDVLIDGTKLETFSGNGLIVCSSLGSTAYNRSLGGALVCPALDILQITEIAPILNRSYRSIGSSLILSGHKKVEFVGNLSHVVVGYDHLTANISDPRSVKISLSNKKVRILHRSNYVYVDKLRECFFE